MLEYLDTGHQYYLDGRPIPSVSRILQELGLTGRFFNWKAAERGTAAHLACELWDYQELEESETDPDILGYVEAYKLFVAESGFRHSQIEKIVCSKAWGYAGRADRIGVIKGENTLVDLKTGQVPDWGALQTAAYAHAYEEETGEKIIHRIGLQLKTNGTYQVRHFLNPQDGPLFLSAVQLWRWKEKL